MISGLFVTGTDTGVGKTLVSCAIVRILRQMGMDAVGFKPMASGEEHGRWADVEALADASDRVEEPDQICPLRYRAPMAPVQAALLEGAEPDLALATRALADLRRRHEVVIVEGIGGLLVPLDRESLVLDFIRTTTYPAVVVSRARLGTVNHTLLTLRELDRAGIAVAGVVMNVTDPDDANNLRPSMNEIGRHTLHPIVATLPYGGGDIPIDEKVRGAMRALAADWDLKALLSSSA